MVTLTGVRPDTRQPDTPAARAAYRADDLSGHAHRQLIGYMGLVLPLLLVLIAVARDGMDRWRTLESISAYYYTGAVAAFVGMLVALALFLFTYRGYRNEYHWADRAAAILAAHGARQHGYTKRPKEVLCRTLTSPDAWRSTSRRHANATFPTM